ncbi:hypothetical protein V5E97_09565 [Singulisphaera sp. Ch08]|uniref:SWIM-type domain-containing protein n=1 Tax=Singulisphaera sp. Ch08 TaxID=3120278 RepID=A0AAU7CMN9_9BACT
MATVAPVRRQVKPRHFAVTLSLEITGTAYSVAPITEIQDETIEKSWRLEKFGNPDAIYDVARGTDGILQCTCPDYEARHRGLSLTGCKHCRAVVAMGLLEAANLLRPTPEERALLTAPVVEGNHIADAGKMVEPVACRPSTEEIPCVACSTSPTLGAATMAAPLFSVLPEVNGAGLSQDELFRLNRAENTARAAYSADCPDADITEVFRVGSAARTDALRTVLKDRPVACVTEIVTPGLPAGADTELTEQELEILAELNATNPDGAIEIECERFPARAEWPASTSNFYWTACEPVEPEEEPRISLAALIESEAAVLRARGLAAYELMGDHLEDLARIVRNVDAVHPNQVWARVDVLDRDFTAHAAAWELPAPERNSSGQWA